MGSPIQATRRGFAKRLLIALGLTGVFLTPLEAQQACAPRAEVIASLAKDYGEHPAGRGIIDQTHITELFVSPDTETWTLIVTRADGQSCVVSAGQGWESQELPLPGQPS